MPWYKAGTVSVTLNSNAVTGSGTAFIVNCRVGDAFRGPDGGWYEIINVASDTALAIDPPYQGASEATGAYALAPMQGYVKDSADQLRAIVNTYGAKLAALGTTGNYDVLPVIKGGTGGTSPAEARNGLELGAVATDNIVPVERGGTGGTTQEDARSALGLVKTTSAYDATPGRLLKTADLGLGATSGSYDGVASMDSFFTANQMFTSTLAAPPGHNQPLLGSYPMGLHLRRSSNVESQLVMGWGPQGALGFRLKTDISTWAPWRKVYDTGNLLGPVSQVGGVPTGAVIESGSNPNGSYVKFADGTMICTLSITVTDQSISDAYGPVFQSSRSWVFPMAFIAAPVVTCGAFKWGSAASWGGTSGAASTSGCSLRGWDYFSRASGTSTYISAIAVGRWFA